MEPTKSPGLPCLAEQSLTHDGLTPLYNWTQCSSRCLSKRCENSMPGQSKSPHYFRSVSGKADFSSYCSCSQWCRSEHLRLFLGRDAPSQPTIDSTCLGIFVGAPPSSVPDSASTISQLQWGNVHSPECSTHLKTNRLQHTTRAAWSSLSLIRVTNVL